MASQFPLPDSDRPRAPRSARALRWVLTALVVGWLVLLLVLAVGGLIVVRQGVDVVVDVAGLFTQPQPTPALHTRAVLLRELRGASELATAIYSMETVVTEQQDRRVGGLVIGQTELLYVASGEVRAGVDLATLSTDDVVVQDGAVTVQLPPPQILDEKIDVERSYVYDMRRSLFAPAAPQLQGRAEQFALRQIVAGACEGGVLERANERAVLTVETLLRAAEFDAVTVLTQPPDAGACPDAMLLPSATVGP